MRKWITLLMTCLVVGSYANANTGQVNLEAGYRRDNISWKNRFPSDDPEFSSSHRFKDLDIFQIGVNARSTLGCNFYVRGNAYWGWILDGDYERHAETNFSDSYNSDINFGRSTQNKTVVDDKYVYGIGAAIGYPFYFCDCTTVVAPVIGYSFDEQSVQLDTKNFENFDGYGSGCNGGNCCRQTFNSRWYGPFVGVDFNYRPYCSCWNLYADVEFHWGDFRGRRNHNRDDDNELERNQRSTNARGWVFAAGAEYDLCNCWTVGFSVKFQDWDANRHHHLDLSSGDYNFDSGRHDRARNNNKWHSYAINLTVGKEF